MSCQNTESPLEIALRTYLLSLSLSLGPSVVGLPLSQTIAHLRGRPVLDSTTLFRTLGRIVKRELALDGFSFSMTFAVAGGAILKKYLREAFIVKGLFDDFYLILDGSEPHLGFEGNATTVSFFARAKAWFNRLMKTSPEQETFICNIFSSSIGLLLLQAGIRRNRREDTRSGRPSPTLDFSLLLLVRAVDSVVQSFIIKRSYPPLRSLYLKKLEKGKGDEKTEAPAPTNYVQVVDQDLTLESRVHLKQEGVPLPLTSRLDVLVFWACSARIMWCFFYEPYRLPQTYVTWIQKLAILDPRIVEALRLRRNNKWSYQSTSSSNLEETCRDLGYPTSWGNFMLLPAYGGTIATEAWKTLGVQGRDNIGGFPCEVFHYLPSVFGNSPVSTELRRSCAANGVLRMGKGFLDAMAIYLPVHILPVLLTTPQTLLRPHRLLQTFLGSVRSSTFLSSFIAIFWFSVCCTRTLVLARLFPFISHNFWDGSFGGIMVGCLTCGFSVAIENGRRRGEMALYVLPKALRTCFPNEWLRKGNRWGFRIVERFIFTLSLATLLTAATHRPESLRGLSRWTLAFIMKGPSAGFWERRRRDPSAPSTPRISSPDTNMTLNNSQAF